jgi:hypothetical protein
VSALSSENLAGWPMVLDQERIVDAVGNLVYPALLHHYLSVCSKRVRVQTSSPHFLPLFRKLLLEA